MELQTINESLPLPEWVYYLSFTISVLSLLGLLFIIFTYLFCTNPNNTFFKMTFLLAVSDVVWIVSSFIITSPDQLSINTCDVMAIGREFGLISSLLWATLISWTIRDSVKAHKMKPFSKWYYPLIYIPSIIFTMLPIFYNAYGPSDIYCWVESSYFMLSLGSYMIPLGCCFVVCLVCYIQSLSYLRSNVSKEVSQQFKSLLIYPAIIFFANIFSVVDRVYTSINPGYIMWLTLLHIITRQGQGIMNSIAYGMNYSVRRDILNRLKFGKNQKNELEESDFNLSIQEIKPWKNIDIILP